MAVQEVLPELRCTGRYALAGHEASEDLPENGQELVLQEEQTMRVFHRATGTLLRQFPHSERNVDEVRRILEKRAGDEAASEK